MNKEASKQPKSGPGNKNALPPAKIYLQWDGDGDPSEIQTERNYRVTERLGIMREDALDPQPQQLRIARDEAADWQSRFELQQRFDEMKEKQRIASRDLALRKRFGK